MQAGGNGDVGYFAHNQDVVIDVPAHRIAASIKFSREGLVHHGYVLRIRAVCVCKDAACQHRHLKGVEISGSDIQLIGPTLRARLLSVA